MKIFSGFPSGKVEVTPLPNLFFSELLPAIDDAAELKITLHIFWLLAQRKQAFIRAADLRADKTLTQSLSALGEVDGALARGLALATERGTLLQLSDYYFLNTEKGRRAFDKMQSEELPDTPSPEPAQVEERANIFSLYENSFGLMLTPVIADELKAMEQDYPIEWITDALKETVLRGNKNLKYTQKILERWKVEGRTARKPSKSWYDEYGKFIKR